jgi:hypothetical protein
MAMEARVGSRSRIEPAPQHPPAGLPDVGRAGFDRLDLVADKRFDVFAGDLGDVDGPFGPHKERRYRRATLGNSGFCEGRGVWLAGIGPCEAPYRAGRPRCDNELSCPHAPVAQRIEHLTSDQRVGGSSPSGRATNSCVNRALGQSGDLRGDRADPQSDP